MDRNNKEMYESYRKETTIRLPLTPDGSGITESGIELADRVLNRRNELLSDEILADLGVNYEDIESYVVDVRPEKNGDAIIGSNIITRVTTKDGREITDEQHLTLSDIRNIDSIYNGILTRKYREDREEMMKKRGGNKKE